MRDALRAKTTYTATSQNMDNIPIPESHGSPSPIQPLSPTSVSPMPVSPVPPEVDETTPNGTTATSRDANASESVEAVANGEPLEGPEVIANGNEGSEVVTNADADKSVDSCQPESKISEVTNGIPEVV